MSLNPCHFVVIILLSFHPSVNWCKHVTSPKWIPWEDTIRSDLFSAGIDSGGGRNESNPTYIARVRYEGGEIVQNVLELQENITFVYHGKEHATSDFDLLVYPQGALIWIEVVTLGNGSCLPTYESLFPGGVDPASREIFYLCRAWHESNLVVGKFVENVKACGVDGGGGEFRMYDIFDLLVKNELKSCPEPTNTSAHKKRNVKADWVPSTQVNISDLFQAGVEDGVPYYIGRTTMFGGTVPGKVRLTNGTANFSYALNGVEYYRKKFDVLVYPLGALTWVQVVTFDYTTCLPPSMFPGGVDPRDDSIFYICRARRAYRKYEDRRKRRSSSSLSRVERGTLEQRQFVVGKLAEKNGVCQASSEGGELWESYEFDVLVENGGGGGATCHYPSFESTEESSSSVGLIVGMLVLVLILLVGGFGVVYYFGWFGLQTAFNNATMRLRRQKRSESVAQFNNVLS